MLCLGPIVRACRAVLWSCCCTYGSACDDCACLTCRISAFPPPTDDLALRHAASQALSRFIEGAAAATEAAGGDAAAGQAAADAAAAHEGGSLLSAAQRVLFPQLKRGLPAPNLAVRQVRQSIPDRGWSGSSGACRRASLQLAAEAAYSCTQVVLC